MLRIAPEGSTDLGPCADCGQMNRRVYGFVYLDENAYAVYYVHWTLNRITTHGARFDVLFGEWGEDATPDDRYHVALDYGMSGNEPGFRIVDADTSSSTLRKLAATACRREDILGSTIAKRAFEVIDAIWLQDDRLHEFHC